VVSPLFQQAPRVAKKSSGATQELIRVSAESIWNKPLTKRQKTALDRIAARQKRGDSAERRDSDIPALSDRQLAHLRRAVTLLLAGQLSRVAR
jgi:hypothetical protein